MEKPTPVKAEAKPSEFRAYRVYAILIVFIAVASVSTYFLYTKTQSLFRWSLDERMISVASVAATKFDPIELDKIEGSESIGTEAYQKVVLELQNIRKKTRKAKYVYIFRKTDDPLQLEFVADADSLHPDVPEDINHDGQIEENDSQEFQGKDPNPAFVPAKQSSAQPGRLAVDIYEQDDYYIVRAPIAGVRLMDLDIEVTGNVLTIRGNRRPPDTIPGSQFYLQECYWGPFSRSVTLPIEIDPRKVRATFNKDYILKVLIPKEDRVKIVRITEG